MARSRVLIILRYACPIHASKQIVRISVVKGSVESTVDMYVRPENSSNVATTQHDGLYFGSDCNDRDHFSTLSVSASRPAMSQYWLHARHLN